MIFPFPMQKLETTTYAIEAITEHLKKGGVIAHPTDTCYGLAAAVFQRSAVAAIHALKESNPKKPLSILVADLEMAKRFAIFSKRARALAERWPAPLTLILPRSEVLPEWVSETGTVGVRVPDHAWTRQLIAALGEPIVTTSANAMSEKEAYDATTVTSIFGDRAAKIGVDLWLVDGGSLPQKKPSTLAAVEGETVRVLRQGDAVV